MSQDIVGYITTLRADFMRHHPNLSGPSRLIVNDDIELQIREARFRPGKGRDPTKPCWGERFYGMQIQRAEGLDGLSPPAEVLP